MARPKGTGAVYWDASRKRWRGVIEAGWTRAGKRRRITVSAPTERECKQKLKDREREILLSGATAANPTTTVKTYSDTWLEAQSGQVRASAYNSDRWAIRNYIVPTIGNRRLSELSAGDIRAAYTAALDAGLAGTSASRVHATLSSMMKAAALDGHTIPPGAREQSGPSLNESPAKEIPLPDALKILAAARARPDYSRWMAAFLQGMRPAECLGLTWSAVDFEYSTITVEWQLKRLPYKKPRDPASGFRVPRATKMTPLVGAYHLVRPKTASGRRVIPMLPWMADALREWKRAQDAAGGSPYGLVWPRADGLPGLDKQDRKAWREILVAAGLTPDAYRLYDVRHTTASILARLGVPEHIITMVMGHASIISTEAYLHVTMEDAVKALTGVGEHLRLGDGG